jgi:hypothetical protein
MTGSGIKYPAVCYFSKCFNKHDLVRTHFMGEHLNAKIVLFLIKDATMKAHCFKSHTSE